jgi:hypothetical protein
MQGGKSALRVLDGHLHLVNVPSSAVVGGGHSGPTNELSPDSWSGHSSPHETGDVSASAPSQRKLHKDDLRSHKVVQWSWTMRLQGWIYSLMWRPLPGLPPTLHLQLQLLYRLQ